MTVAPVAAVLDYEAGNVRSAKRGLDAAGARGVITADPGEASRADVLVIPGVGHFGTCVARLREGGLVDVIADFIDRGRPVLGICVGMQLLYAGSDEAPDPGLGLLDGWVRRFPAGAIVPHMGWDVVRAEAGPARDPLLAGVDGERLYFAHSYYAAPEDRAHVVASCTYAGAAFPCVVRQGSVTGTQFHPEKSGSVGSRLLRNWLETLA
jgi:imidazole glycerol-phosphate synthase subunit HisH